MESFEPKIIVRRAEQPPQELAARFKTLAHPEDFQLLASRKK